MTYGETGTLFRLLGTFEVTREGRVVSVNRRRERALLAVLLLEAGRVISVERLIDLLWDANATNSARSALHAHVSRLRSALDPAGDGACGFRLLRSGVGYLAEVDWHAVDALEFRALVRHARDLRTLDERAETLRRALRLWRGPMLPDVDPQLRDRIAPPWEAARLDAVQAALEAELALGNHDTVVGELDTLASEYPERERLTGLLMIALFRCARRSEALDAFARLRRYLRAELSLEPSPQLQALYRHVLADDPELARSAGCFPGTAWLPSAGEQVRSSPPEVPHMLPRGIRHFTGRTDELASISRICGKPGRGAAPVLALTGVAGIGKTAIAVRWAHQHRDLFPDGQLYLDLRGFDSGNMPVETGAAVRMLLDALGVPAAHVPSALTPQMDMYRGMLAARRVLLLLDNARCADQVRPLLHPAAGCLVLVTSRSSLPRLLSDDEDAPTVALAPFGADEACQFLARRLGAARVSSEQTATADLARVCDGLPLALHIVSARGTREPDLTLRTIVDELRDTRQRLGPCSRSSGVATAGALAATSCSYQALSSEGARLFRLMSIHPGPDINLGAAERLADLSSGQTAALIGELTAVGLVAKQAPDRYAMHDLVAEYAAGLCADEDSGAERADAARRALGWYVDTASHSDLVTASSRG